MTARHSRRDLRRKSLRRRKKQKRTGGLPPDQLQHGPQAAERGVRPQEIGKDAVGLPLFDHSAVQRRNASLCGGIQVQRQAPGDMPLPFRLQRPDDPGPVGPASQAQVDAEGLDGVVVRLPHHVADQRIIGALLILQHFLGQVQILPLEAPPGQLPPQIHQLADAALGVLLDLPDTAVHNGFRDGPCEYVPIHLRPPS